MTGQHRKPPFERDDRSHPEAVASPPATQLAAPDSPAKEHRVTGIWKRLVRRLLAPDDSDGTAATER
jgi:hypothetical protein